MKVYVDLAGPHLLLDKNGLLNFQATSTLERLVL